MADYPALQDILVPRNSGCLSTARIQNESCCTIKYDRILRLPVLVMKGSLTTSRVRIPREESPLSFLHLPYSLIVLQTYLGSFDSFALEVGVGISRQLSVKLTIGTQFNKPSAENPSNGVVIAKMPLIIPRNRWVQVVIHVSGIVTQILNLPPIKFIDSISLSGTCKASRIMLANDEDEAINATPPAMALFAVPAYAPPIWQTAGGAISPSITNNKSIESTDTAKHRLSNGQLPVVKETSEGVRSAGALGRQEESVTNRTLPQPPSTAPPTTTRPHPLTSPLQEQLEQQPKQEQEQQQQQQKQKQLRKLSSITKGDSMTYIRLVDETGASQHRNPIASIRQRSGNVSGKENVGNSAAASSLSSAVISASPHSTPVIDALQCITGWKETVDIGGSTSLVSSTPVELTGKGRVSTNHESGTEQSSGGGNIKSNSNNSGTDNSGSRTQPPKKMTGVRKRVIQFPTKFRKTIGADGQLVADNDSGAASANTAKRKGLTLRRTRIRKQIKLLREAQLSVRRIQEIKKLPASEMPIDPQEEALMMVGEETVDVLKEPRCGYGFGYLGVLHEGGGFETDEGADTKLKGALTLDLPDISGEEEEEEEEKDDDDDDDDEGE
ncbi:uncharacterized protein TM35_000181210 [Trypanosoma theileri]|uniref:CFA20 domain-containing protein n=1 Tax=Trypanosoma theileri TaxID=67003 RepID=A0A1X0NTM7_9TRYP|nr:uncharacterized protein TM35_000181210 [Trypanosoma theileri]ORC88064.1 hypothetical protein TM35_000181210 [Trypanosoma theileri]